MNSLTTERSSSPNTIRANVRANNHDCRPMKMDAARSTSVLSPSLDARPMSFAKDEGLLPSRIPSFPHPRFVVTLDAPFEPESGMARIPIAITGKWVRDGNDFSITLGDLEEIVRNFNQRRNGEINVDYDHASEMPEVAAGGPVPSAGRIVRLEEPEALQPPLLFPSSEEEGNPQGGPHVMPAGVTSPLLSKEGWPQAGVVRYIMYGQYVPTPRARRLIESREYRFISPAINWAGRDKRTGKITGTTLTSVALTNRPFLEELPQIRLSDPSFQFVDVGDVHVDTSMPPGDTDPHRGGSVGAGLAPPSLAKTKSKSGGSMKQVKLSVQDGKIKVTHGDFPDGYFADPAELKQCLDELGDDSGVADGPDAALAAELESLAGLTGGPDSAGAGSATLSECVAEIRRRLATREEISLKEAGALLSENEAGGKSIAAADYFRARVEQELDEAVKNGKVLPRQRDDWRKIALSDFPTFRKIVAEQKPQVPLRPLGLSGSGPEDAQTQVKLLAEQRMRERQISFGQALSEIGREQPELVHQYRRAVSA